VVLVSPLVRVAKPCSQRIVPSRAPADFALLSNVFTCTLERISCQEGRSLTRVLETEEAMNAVLLVLCDCRIWDCRTENSLKRQLQYVVYVRVRYMYYWSCLLCLLF